MRESDVYSAEGIILAERIGMGEAKSEQQVAGKAALVVSDESSAGRYITGGVMRLPSANLDAAANALSNAKRQIGVGPDAELHCRVMFHPDARRKSPFKKLTSNDLHQLVRECVAQMNTLGASWCGAWVDQTRYPQQLQLVDGKPFAVTPKHLAGLVCFVALMGMIEHNKEDFDLAFDPDPTKIDWGLVQRTQATHFARVYPNTIQLPDAHKPLLEMADVAAYALAQSRLAALEPNNRKLRQFSDLPIRMGMNVVEFAYAPPSPS
jgi:hypothetical protein